MLVALVDVIVRVHFNRNTIGASARVTARETDGDGERLVRLKRLHGVRLGERAVATGGERDLNLPRAGLVRTGVDDQDLCGELLVVVHRAINDEATVAVNVPDIGDRHCEVGEATVRS